jgi:hypothetical protein
MCVCVGFVVCGCFGNMCTCIYCVLYCVIYVYLFFVCFRLILQVTHFYFYVYVFLLLCMFCFVCFVFIVPTGTLRLPWLRVFRAFSSVVRQMPGYNSQRRGMDSILRKLIVFYVLFVCKCILYYCHWVSTQLQLTNISIYRNVLPWDRIRVFLLSGYLFIISRDDGWRPETKQAWHHRYNRSEFTFHANPHEHRPAYMSMCVHHDCNTFACILATKLQFANHIFNIAELSLSLAFAIKS